MGDLSEEYAGRVRFEVRDVDTDEGRAAVQEYGWQDALHGLVTLSPDGEMVGTIPGHRYGKEEVQAKVEELLAKTAEYPGSRPDASACQNHENTKVEKDSRRPRGAAGATTRGRSVRRSEGAA